MKKIKTISVFIAFLFIIILINPYNRFQINNNNNFWQFQTNSKITSLNNLSPFVFDDRNLYFHNEDGYTYAINKFSGKEQWNFRSDAYSIFPVSVDESKVYTSDFDGRVYALNKKTGKEIWRFITPGLIKAETEPVISDDLIFFASRNGIFYALDKNRGEKKWEFATRGIDNSKLIKDEIIIHFGLFSLDDIHVYINSSTDNKIYCLDKINGQLVWSFPLTKFIYQKPLIEGQSVSFSDRDFDFVLEKNSGKVLTKTKGNNNIANKDNNNIPEDILNVKEIDPTTIIENSGNYYVLSSDGKNIYMFPLKYASSINTIKFKLIKSSGIIISNEGKIRQALRYFIKKVNYFIQLLKLNLTNRQLFPSLSLEIPKDKIGVYDIYEITIHRDDFLYENKWEDVIVTADFTDQRDQKYHIQGFYYDKNTWKIRFTPATDGRWDWEITFQSPLLKILKEGGFTAFKNDNPGFVRISSEKPNHFVYDNGKTFIFIGLQDCFRDNNHNGDPLDQWAIGMTDKPSMNNSVVNYADLNTYLTTYGSKNSGFNLFRWTVDNYCSGKLWREITDRQNIYNLNEGLWGDKLVQALKDHNFRIWMTLFSYDLPISGSLNNNDYKQAIKKYFNYIVARFSAYVDIWELTDNGQLDTEWYELFSSYLRSIDPYKHPIAFYQQVKFYDDNDDDAYDSVNLSQDINSIHWFASNDTTFNDLETVYQISAYSTDNKPLVFNEVGNFAANWDLNSSRNFRTNLWVSYFQNAYLIFWNYSSVLFQNENKLAYIYLGPIERKYVNILKNFINDTGNMTIMNIGVKDINLRTYGLKSDNQILIYLYNGNQTQKPIKTSIDINLPKKGQIEWLNLQSGNILETAGLDIGSQKVQTPLFAEDLAGKIRLKN